MNRLLIAVTAAGLAACGASPDEKKKAEGPDPCKVASVDLANRLAPEFDKVVTGRRLALAPPGGCALVYLQKDEELADEVAGEGGGFGVVDQQLAVAMPDGSGKSVLTLVGASAMAPGPALLTLDAADVDGDGTAELVVQEAAGDYQGLRIFLLPPSGGEPVEVFADHLKVKTPEGIDIAARWTTAKVEGANAIVLDGAGTKKVYTWDRSGKKFAFNAAATEATRPKPEVPAAPVSEAPASGPADAGKADAGKANAGEADAKAVEKKEEKAAPKAEAPKEEVKDPALEVLETTKGSKGKKGKGKADKPAEEAPKGPVTLPDLGL